MSVQLAHEPPFRLGEVEVRPSTREVVWPGGRETLQPRVMQVLVVLAQAHGEVLTRDDLIQKCWEGRFVGEDAITLVMVKLRKLASATGDGFVLETIPRVGYRLATPSHDLPPLRPEAKPGVGRRGLMIGGAAAVAAVAAGGLAYRLLQPQPKPPLTVAVLPFDDLSPQPIEGYVPQGLAREVRNSLSRVGGLRVISDSSSFALRRANLSPTAVGERLKADLVLTGSVSETQGSMRVSAELTDSHTGIQVWSQSFMKPADELFQLEDTVASTVIQELVGRGGPDLIKAPPAIRPRDPEVYRIMLSSNHLLEQTRALRMAGRDPDGDDVADEIYAQVQRALKIDADDSDALVALASLTRNGWPRELARQPLSSAQRASEGAEILRRALVADPGNPAALAALGDYYRRFEWNWTEAESLFRRALAIDPNHIEAHWAYGYMLGTLGRNLEGLIHARILVRLDPETVWRRLALPRMLLSLGARDQAMAHYRHELLLNRDNLFLLRELYIIHLSESDAAAMHDLDRLVRTDLWKGAALPPPVEAMLGRMAAGAEALAGRPAALVALVDADVAAFDAADLHAATRQGRASVDFLFFYAMEYAWAGQVARSVELLDRALSGRSLYWPPSLPYGPDPFPKLVSNDPRFRAVWLSEPARAHLLQLRLASLEHGQTSGDLPNGRRIVPRLPSETV
ncbi:MAG: hypothetical protein E7812_01660 [Phenylobacterium sp.]|nr:MAG: hypothetical protein E7812_01660 [Phenylobacterium sp.]